MVTLILTTMNEREGIKSLWNRIPFHLFKSIIIVDNHSTDGTLEFIQNASEMRQQKIRIIQQTKTGRGNGIQEAMTKLDDDTILIMASDGNDQPEYISDLIATQRDGGYDLVTGSRFLFPDGARTDDSDDPFRFRKFSCRVLTRMVNVLFGGSYSDSNFGLRIFTKSAWDKMKINPEKNETELLMSIRAAKLRLRVTQIPVVEGRRVGGEVKAKTWDTIVNHLTVILSELR